MTRFVLGFEVWCSRTKKARLVRELRLEMWYTTGASRTFEAAPSRLRLIAQGRWWWELRTLSIVSAVCAALIVVVDAGGRIRSWLLRSSQVIITFSSPALTRIFAVVGGHDDCFALVRKNRMRCE